MRRLHAPSAVARSSLESLRLNATQDGCACAGGTAGDVSITASQRVRGGLGGKRGRGLLCLHVDSRRPPFEGVWRRFLPIFAVKNRQAVAKRPFFSEKNMQESVSKD